MENANACRLPDISIQAADQSRAPEISVLPEISVQASSSSSLPQANEEPSLGNPPAAGLLRLPELSAEAAVASKGKLGVRKVKRKTHGKKTHKYLSNILSTDEAASRRPSKQAAGQAPQRTGSIEDWMMHNSRRGSKEDNAEVGGNASISKIKLGNKLTALSKPGASRAPSRAPSRNDAGSRSVSRANSRCPSRTNSPGPFLPKVRGATFTIVEDHPFFKGTSDEFRQEIIPLVSRRHIGEHGNEPPGPDIRGLDRQGVFSSCDFQMASSSKVRVLLKQGEDAPDELDGLLLTDPRFDADIEVLFEGHAISCVRSNGTLGGEVALGITKKSAFGLVLRQEPSSSVYFISRTVLQEVLKKEVYAQDAVLLQARVQMNAGDMLHHWFCNNESRVKIRLFTNVNPEFKSQLLRKVKVRLAAAGSTITKEHCLVDICTCIFIGEASVHIQGKQVGKLAHDQKASAWAAWWGFLEASGTCELSPASVTATTDCTVWDLSSERLKELRSDFPVECGFFDKVAVKHVKMLTPFALGVWQVPVLRECAPQFLQAVSLASTQRICSPGDVVVRQDDRGSEMFVLVRGQCGVFRGHKQVAHLSEGMCFGELAVLGISDLRTATIIADTVCDLRVLDRVSLLKALSQFPDESARLQQIAEAHGYSRRIAVQELKHVPAFHVFQDRFIQRLAEHMYEQAFFVDQMLFQQDGEQWNMYVLVRGAVKLEMGQLTVCEVHGPIVVGAMALVQPGARSLCSVRCGSVCEVLTINTKQVSTDLQSEYPQEMARFEQLANDLIEEFRGHLLKVFDQLSAQDVQSHCTDEDALDQQVSQITQIRTNSKRKRDSLPQERKSLVQMDSVKRNSITNIDSEDIERRDSLCPIRWEKCFFSDSDRGFLKRLSSVLEKRIFFDGQVMLREGDVGEYALLLHSGVGVVEVGGTRVAEVKRGDFLGEVVLLGFSEQYTATIKAAGLVTAFAVDKHGLRKALEDFPDEKNRLEEVMKKRVKLTRQLTKVNSFCSFVGEGEEHEEAGRKSLRGGSRRSLHRSSMHSRGSRHSIAPVRNSVARFSTLGHRGSRMSLFSTAGRRSEVATPSDRGSPNPRQYAPNMEPLRDSEFEPPPSTAGRSSLGGLSTICTERSEEHPNDQEASPWNRKISVPKLSGRAHGQRWVDRRKEALRVAAWRQKCAQARLGNMTEMLTPGEGYRATKAGLGAGFPCLPLAPTTPKNPSFQRFQQAESVYGKPVWHEVYGDPTVALDEQAV